MRGTSLKAVVSEALERELGPAARERVPVRTHVWPPPDDVTRTVPSRVVLDAIRRLRDGIAEPLREASPTTSSEGEADIEGPAPRRKRSRGRSS